MAAYCKFLDSPAYNLDQESTYDAIKELQLFVNRYPNSDRVEECNKYLDILRDKLEKKIIILQSYIIICQNINLRFVLLIIF